MKSVLDPATREELIERIQNVTEERQPLWGKMTAGQMLRHCTIGEAMFQGKVKHKRAFLGYVLGRTILKKILQDDQPMRRNSPTGKAFIVKETNVSVAREKEEWMALIKAYAQFEEPFINHWFFGKMTREQVGCFVYKHADHHLRQFGC
jgi:hypothetical protein